MSSNDRMGTIEAHLAEQEYYKPPNGFIEQANVKSSDIYERFDEFPDGFEEYANLLDWYEKWDETFDGSNPPFYKWFVGGKINASYNCIDRHLTTRKNQTALLWEGENGEQKNISYQDLYREVNEISAALKSIGVKENDIVTLHLPMVLELPMTMLACARIGAPHS